ncbi:MULTISPECIES: 3-hydroxy-9,10-secoandrosta-1,3,5(10)-triene-9,17-dione monooxygenase reductase subunit [unclassified Gordonia (in: high G+C Gram-positive bacteria)]|uniref:3-hydroxy-9,10-secoandrosta-1,3,5(10)-triene-9, 17-dione monooxygenase reductase subunit n=1 Tax=unclassified Gordonia (in: high G+C Gram-positive bacteria) TaxID=2657482 RepID=UPI0024B54116|nr:MULTISPECIES: 3-hydroxy-9,10-secoandrosta-1,3,5(10)-triene-9,17-dione monooxygenase reductase subunit [unclassified Gordonia (in: high G+C Gram-positive bacteria)]
MAPLSPYGTADFDSRQFRTAMGQFCTGVTIITTMRDDVPVGFACQSFAALSLDPPLVIFCPMKTSRTWPLIEARGAFCVNVLAHRQQEVSAKFGAPGEDKFAGVQWDASPLGLPVIRHCLTWVECTIENVLDGGDHCIVVGRAQTLGEVLQDKPLLFYRGGYLSTERPRVTPAQEHLDDFLTWTGGDEWL